MAFTIQTFEAGGFTAGFLPEAGGNMVRLRHNASGVEILRTPPEDFDYLTKPEIWGMPVLMPPNRIRDGRFEYQNRVYQLPVNEPPPRNNTLHGIILHKPWQLQQLADNTLELSIDYPGAAADEGWMHKFSTRLRYEFGENTVQQQIEFTNQSDLTMPLMVGFHSAFCFPEGTMFYLDASTECRQLDDLRKIVNGQTVILPDWQQFRTIRHGERILGHCAMLRSAGNDPELILRYSASDYEMHYILPEPWREWVIWNNTGTENFLCVEPQSCRIDAMNIGLPLNEAGVIELAPGASQKFSARIEMRRHD